MVAHAGLLRLAVTLLLSYLPFAGPAEQGTTHTDSLHRVIATAKHDTTRLGTMVALSEAIYASDPDSNMTLCKVVVAEARHLAAVRGVHAQVRARLHQIEGNALNNLAASHFIFGELDSALALFLRAEAIHAKHGTVALQAAAINNQGLVHEVLGAHAAQEACLRRALALFRSVGAIADEATALGNLGSYYKGRGRPDSAMAYHEDALALFMRQNDRNGVANAMLNIGQHHADQGQPVEALEKLLEAQRLYTVLNDKRGLATCLNNLGSLFQSQALSRDALDHYHRALDLQQALGNLLGQAMLHGNIGALLEQHGERATARDHLERGLALYLQVGDILGAAIMHGQLGDIEKKSGHIDEAEAHFGEALRLAREADHPADIATALYKTGYFMADQGRLAEAENLFRQALAIELSINEREEASYTLAGLSKVSLAAGRAQEAEQQARRSLALARELGYPVVLERAARALYEVLAAREQWREATAMLELRHQMKDSVENAGQGREALRLHMRYVFGRQQAADSLAHQAEVQELEHQRTVATLKAQQARNRSWTLGIVAALLLAGGGALYRVDRKRRQERHERLAAQAEMRTLRAQMNPHFLFNALHSLHSYIQENDRTLASGFLVRLTKLMRMVLEHSRHDEITLEQELDALRLYMDLEQQRMNGHFDHRIEVDPDIDPATTLVPPMLIQPFVENAIWHGISAKEGRGRITVQVRAADGQLLIAVEDDGVGRAHGNPGQEQAATGEKTSLGTRITQERLDLLIQRSGSAATMRYTDLTQGTRVEVELPWVRE